MDSVVAFSLLEATGELTQVKRLFLSIMFFMCEVNIGGVNKDFDTRALEKPEGCSWLTNYGQQLMPCGLDNRNCPRNKTIIGARALIWCKHAQIPNQTNEVTTRYYHSFFSANCLQTHCTNKDFVENLLDDSISCFSAECMIILCVLLEEMHLVIQGKTWARIHFDTILTTKKSHNRPAVDRIGGLNWFMLRLRQMEYWRLTHRCLLQCRAKTYKNTASNISTLLTVVSDTVSGTVLLQELNWYKANILSP